MHVGESSEEFEMFVHRRGALFDWLKTQRDNSDCGHGSPVQVLADEGVLGENLLAVHLNWLAENDARLLAKQRCQRRALPAQP
jgi:cytosine/adenosine deaminase-related metal-dependent hydrolase